MLIPYINRIEDVKFSQLQSITKQIWKWENIRIFASYIKSQDNSVADKESRCRQIETEYTLNKNDEIL